MTTTKSSKASRQTASKDVESTRFPAAGIAAAVLIAAVVAAIIAALALGGTGDEAADSSVADAARIPTSGTLRQVSFVDTEGTALPRLDDTVGVDAAIGAQAPTITASHFDNTETTIDFADGQPRVVLFFAHWCPHCQEEVRTLVERFESEGLRDDVDIVAVSTSVDEGAPNYPPSRWFLAEEWPVPVLRDSANNDLAASFGLSGFPYTVVIDADGTVVARQSGAVPEAQWDLLLDLAAG